MSSWRSRSTRGRDDPHYFLTPGGFPPASVEDITKDTCLFPARYLDDECRNSTVYDHYVLAGKFTADDWKKGKKKAALVVKKLDSFTKDELPVANE